MSVQSDNNEEPKDGFIDMYHMRSRWDVWLMALVVAGLLIFVLYRLLAGEAV